MVHSTLFLVPTRNLDALIWLLVEKVIEQFFKAKTKVL